MGMALVRHSLYGGYLGRVRVVRSMKRKPLTIELVGPPGVGKTTLAETLLQRNNRIRVVIFPYFRRIRHIPFFIRSFLSLSPTLLRLYHNRKAGELTPRDIALMTILQGWHRVLGRPGSSNDTIVVLEEGAICLLAKLQSSGSELLKSENVQKWWECMYKQWAETLDLVIRLDTPIPILVERIRARDMAHEIDELTDQEAIKYLTHIRTAQEHVLSALMVMTGAPKILHFNTVDKTPDQIYDDVVAFGLEHGEDWSSLNVPITRNLALN
jgi:thymidylate kinase